MEIVVKQGGAIKSLRKSLLYEVRNWSTVAKIWRRNLLGSKLEATHQELIKFIKPGDICIDVGASFGRYTRDFSKLVGPAGRVYAFEPLDYAFLALNRLMRIYGLKNVQCFNAGLADKKGTMRFVVPMKNNKRLALSMGYLDFGPRPKKFLLQDEVEVTSLDAFCREQGLDKVALIKVDVEGTELSFLKGAETVLKTQHPVVICEIIKKVAAKFQVTPDMLYAYVTGMGFRTFINDGQKFIEVNNFEMDNNYYFIHRDLDELIRRIMPAS